MNGEKLEALPLRPGCPLSSWPLNIVLEVLATVIRQEKEIKCLQIGKEEVKLSLLIDDMILYREKPKESTKKICNLYDSLVKLKDIKSAEKKSIKINKNH